MTPSANRTAAKYCFIATILFFFLFIVTCNKTQAQNGTNGKVQADSMAKVQQQADKFVDSLTRNTSLKSFQEFLFEVEGAKRYATFLEQYNFFIKQKYDLWMEQKKKPK